MWKQTERKTVVLPPRRRWALLWMLLAILTVVGLLVAAGWALLGR